MTWTRLQTPKGEPRDAWESDAGFFVFRGWGDAGRGLTRRWYAYDCRDGGEPTEQRKLHPRAGFYSLDEVCDLLPSDEAATLRDRAWRDLTKDRARRLR